VNLNSTIERTLAYHQRTKHHLHQSARSLGYLDWAMQPDPFRTYAGATRIELDLLGDRVTSSYGDLFRPGSIPPQTIGVETIGILFELSLGLSAWKQYQGSRWALRCNPSSGNLHPTEGYLIVPDVPGLTGGVYHYVSRDHCLERRCLLGRGANDHLTAALPPHGFLIGLSSIHWREAWKYGERAFRYCQHDVGHAIASVRFAAAALGWSARLLDAPGDADVTALLGLDRDADFVDVAAADREHPDVLLLVSNTPPSSIPAPLALRFVPDGVWEGRANPLSPQHVDWPIIDEVAKATWKSETEPMQTIEPVALPPLIPSSQAAAATLIRQRRSCLALDGKTSISAETFYHILDSLLPRPGVPPWDTLPWEPLLHLGIFVHRVRGLTRGLYLLERNAAVHERIRPALRDMFLWKRPPDCPKHLRLWCLAEGDLQDVSRVASCHQEIASNGAFSLGMLAEFGDTIRHRGPCWYRRLFWESGVLGHVLYLEAEAAGIRSTGIGCYFDDVFHELLGIQTVAFQSLYHFTIGGPIDDPRLTTLAPYFYLDRQKPGPQESPYLAPSHKAPPGGRRMMASDTTADAITPVTTMIAAPSRSEAGKLFARAENNPSSMQKIVTRANIRCIEN
jgi:SagB-type dehydrogenase family enzyme